MSLRPFVNFNMTICQYVQKNFKAHCTIPENHFFLPNITVKKAPESTSNKTQAEKSQSRVIGEVKFGGLC